MSQYLFLALILLACPLMMIFMMRGHGHGASHDERAGHSGHVGCGHGGHNGHAQEEPVSVENLRRQRDELDREIAEREWQGASSRDRSPERV